MRFDIRQVPFSRYGSYMSLMIPPVAPPLGEALYLRSHIGRQMVLRDVFRIDMLVDGQRVEPRYEADAAALRMIGPGSAQVTFCMTASHTLRLRGRGCVLRFEIQPAMGVVAQPFDRGRWSVNARSAVSRYMFEPIVGRVTVDAPWGPDQCEHIRVELHASDEDSLFDIAIDQYESTWCPSPREDFDTCLETAARDFEAFVPQLSGCPEGLREAWMLSWYVNWSAVVHPLGNYRRDAMLMSKVVMDQVWSWDHCFNAMALVREHPHLALDQFLVMFDHQDSFGALPDGLNPLFRHYNFSKPQVHGWALRYLMAHQPTLFNRERLIRIYEVLGRWSDWWLEHRAVESGGLLYYLHGNDSGWDNSTMFDCGAPLIAPDLAAILATQLDVLADIAAMLGRHRSARTWRASADNLIEALMRDLWRGDRFVARLVATGEDVDSQSLIPCIPLVLGQRLPEPARKPTIERLRTFITDYGLATEHPDSPRYTPDGYWRGPIWAPPTMLLIAGLRDLDEHELARDLAHRFCHTCARSGFAENFNALTGQPLRDTAYTWTASIFQLLTRDLLAE